MSDGQKILKLIEGIDPKDTAVMDEVDCRFWCLVNNCTFLGFNEELAATPFLSIILDSSSENALVLPCSFSQ